MPQPSRLFTAGAAILGFGVGGLADGILLHHVLQWHNLVSNRIGNETVEGLRHNIFWDGMFHAAVTTLVVTGILMLWRAAQRPAHAIGNVAAAVGLSLVGWGAFHVVDQLVFHLLFNLHDIRDGAAEPDLYNWAFFAVGVVLAAAGAALRRTRGARATRSS